MKFPEIRTDEEAEKVHKIIRRKVKLAAKHLNEALAMCEGLGYDPIYLNSAGSLTLFSAVVIEFDHAVEFPLPREAYRIIDVKIKTFSGPLV